MRGKNRWVSLALIMILLFSISFNLVGCGAGGGESNSNNTSNVTLNSISVTPANPSIAKGTLQQFTATGTYSDNSTHDLTTFVNWTSSAPVVANFSDAGLATAVGAGATTIVANDPSTGLSGYTNLTVTPAQLISIEIHLLLKVQPSSSSLRGYSRIVQNRI